MRIKTYGRRFEILFPPKRKPPAINARIMPIIQIKLDFIHTTSVQGRKENDLRLIPARFEITMVYGKSCLGKMTSALR